MRFEVRAYGAGRISSVEVDAVSRDDAVRQIAAQALRPIAVRELGRRSWHGWRSSAGRFETVLFSQELLALLEAGLSIIVAIETLQDRERGSASHSVLDQLAGCLREGRSFAGALETVPEAFPALFIGIVRSAERTGNLPEAVARYIDYRRRVDGLRTTLTNAAIYPLLLILVAFGVTLFLGGYVVPRFATVYRGSGRPLPWASQLLLQWGDFANSHTLTLVAALTLLGATLAIGLRILAKRGGLARLIRGLPVVAEPIRIYELSRLYLTLGMLLDSGLSVMPALTLTETSLPPHLREALGQAGARIRTGERLSLTFEQTGLATAVGLRMLQVGEESGRLGEMMTRAARFHDEETGRWIERFSRVAEPTLMVAIGLLIGTIVVLLYLPIFDLAGSLR